MINFRQLGIVLLVSHSVINAVSWGQDGLEDAVSRGIEIPLRWHNIEGQPQWVDGKQPQKNGLRGSHKVWLEPGESTCIRIPPFEWLRVLSSDRPFREDDLEVSVSNGSGLLAFVSGAYDTERKSLFYDPRNPHPVLARISRPSKRDRGISVGLFTSRHGPAPSPEYRGLIMLNPQRKVRISTSQDADVLEFWKWDSGDGVNVRLQGPGRFRLDTRFRYPDRETSLTQTYQISVRDMDAGTGSDELANLSYIAGPESSQLVFVDKIARVSGRIESGFFELPEDREYHLAFETTAPVYLRLLKMLDQDFMFPSLNAAASGQGNQIGSRFQGAGRDSGVLDIVKILRNPQSFDSSFLEAAAQRLVRDNSRSEGGMMAESLLWNAVVHRRDLPGVRSMWRNFSHYTFYRSVLPESTGSPDFREAFFPSRYLYIPGKDRSCPIVGVDQIYPAFKRLPSATFSSLSPGQASVYILPERLTSTRVRLVARRDRKQTAEFIVKMAGRSSQKMRLLPDFDAPRQDTRPGFGEAGLHFLTGGTLGPSASFRGRTGPTVSTGIYEFTVPAEVRKIEIQNLEGAEGLPVALQYRTSKEFCLSENEYLTIVSRSGSGDLVRSWLFDCISQNVTPSIQGPGERIELYNHWEPLRRYIQTRFRQFSDSVTDCEMPDSSVSEIDRLDSEGEIFLAERLARSLYLHSRNDQVRREAFSYLNELAVQKNDPELVLLNHCAQVICQPGDRSLCDLATSLRESGETVLALMLAVVVRKEADSLDLRLALTFQEEWWYHFEAILAENPDHDSCEIWRGIRLWHLGFRESARDEWRKAGAVGREWIAHTGATEEARNKIVEGDPSGLTDWAWTELNTPALYLWRPLRASCVTACQSTATVKVRERGTQFQAFTATPEKPVQLAIPTPGLFQIECRPVHSDGSVSPLEGWIEVDGLENQPLRIPVISNYPSPGLEVSGGVRRVPGFSVTESIALHGWNNRIQIRPDFGPVLIRVSRREPEVRAGHLADLKKDTAAWIFDWYRHQASGADETGFGQVTTIDRNHVVKSHLLKSPFRSPSESDVKRVDEVFSQCSPVLIRQADSERLEPVRKMRQWLSDFQTGDPRLTENAVASAAYMLHSRRDLPELQTLYSAIQRKSFWEPVLTTERNAGIRKVETPGWHPESPSILRRLRFLPEPGLRSQYLPGTDSTVAVLMNQAPGNVRVNLSLVTIPFLPGAPLQAVVEVEGYASREIELDPENSTASLSFDIPKGRSAVRVAVESAEPNQYLCVELDSDTDRERLERSTMRNWFVSYQGEPLSVRIDGPAWVRVDRMAETGVESEYQFAGGDVENIVLPPGEEKEELYRVHVLRVDQNRTYQPSPYRNRTVSDIPQPVARQPYSDMPAEVQFNDEFNLHGQEDGTWTGGVSFHKRVIEDEIDGRVEENFGQSDITYRYFNEGKRLYSKTTVLGREREQGEMTFGLKQSFQHDPINSALSYTFDGSVYGQDGELSVTGTGKVQVTGDLAPKWKHKSSASVTARALSRNDPGSNPDELDRDVYSDFKNDHRFGLNFSERIIYSPREDTRIYAGAGLRTNENPLSADSVNYTIGADQLIGNVRLGTNITGYRFFDDNDRSSASSRHRINVDATGEFWTKSQQRFEMGVRFSHSIEEDENSVAIFGRFHFGQGRMFRDFRPSEKIFSHLRERRIPQNRNNRIHFHYHEQESE